jgi:hypothetical protein
MFDFDLGARVLGQFDNRAITEPSSFARLGRADNEMKLKVRHW